MNKDVTKKRTWTSAAESQTLVRLGLPADTADAFYQWNSRSGNWYGSPDFLTQPFSEERDAFLQEVILPCWTTGRLLELVADNTGIRLTLRKAPRTLMIEDFVRTIEKYAERINRIRNFKDWTL